MDILDILEQQGIKYSKTNNPSEILIRCTSGEHTDKTPSMSYNLEKNIFHCWSCNFAGGQRKFLQSIGIATSIPLETKQPYKISKLRNKLEEIKQKDSIRMPSSISEAVGGFRNISAETIKEFEGFFTTELGLEDYICFPVYQFGKLRFIEGRLRFKDSPKPKYYRRPTHASSAEILFPLDKCKHTNHIIIVEGLFDMMNLWQYDYNALCIFGTANFGEKKLELLDKIGTTKVDIMMDGDDSGRKAAYTIAAKLEKQNIQSRIIRLPENKDPGELTREELNFYCKL